MRLNDLALIGPNYRWLLADEGQLKQADFLQYLMEGDNIAIVSQVERGTQLLIDMVR